MAARIYRADYFYATVKDRPGEAYRTLSRLAASHLMVRGGMRPPILVAGDAPRPLLADVARVAELALLARVRDVPGPQVALAPRHVFRSCSKTDRRSPPRAFWQNSSIARTMSSRRAFDT